MEEQIKIVVLTGGPCSGKTSALAFLSRELRDHGIDVLTVDEVATQFITGGIVPNRDTLSLEDFQRHIIYHIIEKENRWKEVAKSMKASRKIIICDRGTLDSMAYMEGTAFRTMIKKEDWTIPELRDGRYDGIIHMRTAAMGALEYYTTENNKARRESPEEARELDQKTLQAWIGHPHLRVIDNSTDFQGKLNRVLKEILDILGLPIPLEIEKKYLIEKPSLAAIPVPFEIINIEQYYLKTVKEGGENRLRKRGQKGVWLYYQTQKWKKNPGVRIEKERLISEKEYENAFRNRDSRFTGIKKQRCCFIWQEQYFELDFFQEPRGDQCPLEEDESLLEIELTEENKKVSIPPFLKVIREVTEDKQFSNREIARIKG